MHFGLIGLGPVGGFIAAHLKNAGHRIGIVDHNEHKLKHLSQNPLLVSGKKQIQVQLDEFYSNLSDLVHSKPDTILVCTKSSSGEKLSQLLKGLNPDENTKFIICQNGIDVENIFSDKFGKNHVMRLIINFGVNFIRRDEIAVNFCYDQFLSELSDDKTASSNIAQIFHESGIPTLVKSDYKLEVFKKAILNSSLSSICALTRLTMKQVMEEPEMVKLVRELLRESIQVAKAQGYDLVDFFEPALSYLTKGGDHKPSMLLDIESGHVTENEFHCGRLFKLAEESKLDVPVIQTIYYLIKNLERAIQLDSYVTKHYHA